jgi:hypothetical protein
MILKTLMVKDCQTNIGFIQSLGSRTKILSRYMEISSKDRELKAFQAQLRHHPKDDLRPIPQYGKSVTDFRESRIRREIVASWPRFSFHKDFPKLMPGNISIN